MDRHPVSSSTPKKAPLKSSNEYLSLKKDLHRKSCEAAILPVPTCESTDLNLQLGTGAGFRYGVRRTHRKDVGTRSIESSEKSSQSQLHIREYPCRNLQGQEIMLSFRRSHVRIGDSLGDKRSVSFVYEPNSTKTLWNVTALLNKQPWKKLTMSYSTNLPFREECKALGIKVTNLQPGVPLQGTRQAAPAPFNLKMKALSTNPRSRFVSIQDKIVTVIESESAICINHGEEFFMRCPWSESTFTFKEYTGEKFGGLKVVRNNDFIEAIFLNSGDSEMLKELINRKQSRNLSKGMNVTRANRDMQSQTTSPLATNTPRKRERRAGLPVFEPLSPLNFYPSSSPQQPLSSGSVISRISNDSDEAKVQKRLPPSSPVHSEKSSNGQMRSLSRRQRAMTDSFLPRDKIPGTTHKADVDGRRPPQQSHVNPEEATNSREPPNHAVHVEAEEIHLDDVRHADSRHGSPKKANLRSRSKAAQNEDDLFFEPSEKDIEALKQNGFKPISYKFVDNKSIRVDLEDIARLGQHIYLNDTIIWFYLKLYMENLTVKHPKLSKQFLVLNTFFYFQMRNSDSAPSWVLKLPFEEKRVIVMPVHEHAHWSVAVIVGMDLALANPEQNKPMVLILDSLGISRNYHSMRKVATAICNAVNAQDAAFIRSRDLKLLQADIPTQTNLTDCGVFLLHYVEQILSQPHEFLKAIENCSDQVLKLGDTFWQPEVLRDKRMALLSHLKDLAGDPTKNELDKNGNISSAEYDDNDDIVEILEHSNRKKRCVSETESATKPSQQTHNNTQQNKSPDSVGPEIGSLDISGNSSAK